jgi:hypothetical protein
MALRVEWRRFQNIWKLARKGWVVINWIGEFGLCNQEDNSATHRGEWDWKAGVRRKVLSPVQSVRNYACGMATSTVPG